MTGFERLAHRGSGRYRDEIGVHQATGGLGVVAEQAPELELGGRVAGAGGSGAACSWSSSVSKSTASSGSIAESSLAASSSERDRRNSNWCSVSSSSNTSASSARVLADSPDDLLAFFVRGRLHEVRQLGRVQPPQLAERDLQVGRRHVGDEGLDIGPVDHSSRP